MNTSKKPKKNIDFWAMLLVFISLAVILLEGNYYVHSLRRDLTKQALSNVMAVTRQHRQAFDTFISGDRERLHGSASYFARGRSDDADGILDKLSAFSEVGAVYSVIDLDKGVCYYSRSDTPYRLSQAELEECRALTGADVRNPFRNRVSGELMFGYYECFTFADGAKGVFHKSYVCARVSEEFSLSFYNGEGLGYVVTREGEILLRSLYNSGSSTFDNIFDIVTQTGNGDDGVADLIRDMGERKAGSTIFKGDTGDYAFTYVPVENVEDWYLVSIVHTGAVTREADGIIMNSQTIFLIFTTISVVFLVFCVLVLRSRRELERKDRELDYQERQFSIFSTYLTNNTDDVYLMFDPGSRRAEYISPNMERVLGISAADCMENPGLFNAVQTDTVQTIVWSDLERLEPGQELEPRDTERINRRTGEHKWFRETIYCVSIQGRKKIIAYISDRTKERQIQDTLTQALDMAQVANKAKTAFLGSVSHDIRTPMNAIMGLTMLLREEAGDKDRVLEYTQRIDAASQHLLGLINDVLDMNKIEGGGATLNISEITMSEIIDEINTIIRPQARAKNQEFKVFASPFTYEHLLGDKLRINQILINILSNSVKYTPEGGEVELSVKELPQRMKGHSHIQLMVRDNGQGMSEEYLKIIFDPFTREQNVRTNLIQGTGLGMAITKSLVDLMGGSIQVESELGRGSTFTVELELRIEEKEDDREFWQTNGVRRMIVADDDEDICRNVVRAMAKTGVMVHYATSGERAIRTMREARERGEPYDLILLDWKMPDLDGLETARLIRKNYSPRIPILFFTAYDWQDIEEEAMEVGVDHFLPKPFFLYSFKKAITRVMSRQSGEEEPSPLKADSVVQGRNILVVDDVEVNRMILVKILHTLGAVCDTAENGRQAVEKFTGSPPGTYDLIMMDVQMPEMDGHAATRAIRASGHPEAGSVAIIAMTANAFVDDVRDALASGMDAHVSKPIVLDQLKSTMQEVLTRKGQREPAPR